MLYLLNEGEAMRILIKYSIKTNDQNINGNIKGLLVNNIIKYKENKIKTEIYLDEKIIKRKGIDYEIYLNFTKKKVIYKIYNQKLNFDIKVLTFEKKDNKLLVIYKLNISEDIYRFEINYEVVE